MCLGGSSAASLHAARQGVSVGWQSFVPLGLLGAGQSPSGGFFVSQKSVLIFPWQVPAGWSTDQGLGPSGVDCPSLALCGRDRAHWS